MLAKQKISKTYGHSATSNHFSPMGPDSQVPIELQWLKTEESASIARSSSLNLGDSLMSPIAAPVDQVVPCPPRRTSLIPNDHSLSASTTSPKSKRAHTRSPSRDQVSLYQQHVINKQPGEQGIYVYYSSNEIHIPMSTVSSTSGTYGSRRSSEFGESVETHPSVKMPLLNMHTRKHTRSLSGSHLAPSNQVSTLFGVNTSSPASPRGLAGESGASSASLGPSPPHVSSITSPAQSPPLSPGPAGSSGMLSSSKSSTPQIREWDEQVN